MKAWSSILRYRHRARADEKRRLVCNHVEVLPGEWDRYLLGTVPGTALKQRDLHSIQDRGQLGREILTA